MSPTHPFESIKLDLVQTDSVSNDTNLTTRSIHLTQENPTTIVGRSSKTVSKGLVPTQNNAYFDILVMSRKHAEFAADFERGVILLTDTRSLHGTSVNNIPLTKDIPRVLAPGDIVRFGTHVARGLEVFSPAGVKVNFVAVKAKSVADDTSSSYKAPEYEISDDECECTDDSNNNSDTGLSKSINNSSDVFSVRDSSDSDGDSLYDPAKPADADKTMEGEEDLGRRGSIYLGDFGEDEGSDDDAESEADDEGDSSDDDLGPRGGAGLVQLSGTGTGSDSEDDSDYVDQGDQDIEDHEIEADSDADEDKKTQDDVGDYLMAQIDHFEARLNGTNDGYMPAETLISIAEAEGVTSKDTDTADVETGASNDVGFSLELQHAQETSPAVNRCNISSILNPSPLSFTPLETAFGTTPSTSGANIDQTSADNDSSPKLPPIVEPNTPLESLIDLAEHEAGEPELASQPPEEGSMLLDSGRQFLNSAPREPFVVTFDEDELDSIAMESAAVFHSYKKNNANKKRKADDMAEYVNACVPESLPLPSAKRQATPAAMQAGNNMHKNRFLAVAEKIGIAALGGAVVLGSLIYTAPTF